MAVTKRMRFEVFRRDNHTCQYCGGRAPDVTLTIDHVVPVALGGDDKPGNLVTACRDCNAGKSSVTPDSPLVESLTAEAAAYALGMIDKMTRFRADMESLDDYVQDFHEVWDTWGYGSGEDRQKIPLPVDYRMTLYRWMRMGIPKSAFELAVPVAMGKTHIPFDDLFSYTSGVVKNMVNEREIDYTVTIETAAVYTAEEVSEIEQEYWMKGRRSGEEVAREKAQNEAIERDYLQHHIDGMTPQYAPNPYTGEPMFIGLSRANAA